MGCLKRIWLYSIPTIIYVELKVIALESGYKKRAKRDITKENWIAF